ncbi:MAG: hypothetical protein WC438_00050 [Candidatus Pacearchaeota archaeon]
MRLHLTPKEEYILEHLRHIFSYVFQTLLILFLVTLLTREFYPDFIDSLININWFMLAVIIIGAISILFPPKQREFSFDLQRNPTKKDLYLIIFLGILGAVIIFLKLKTLGWISYLISMLGGIIIILLSWLILTEKEEN